MTDRKDRRFYIDESGNDAEEPTSGSCGFMSYQRLIRTLAGSECKPHERLIGVGFNADGLTLRFVDRSARKATP
ncbi:MAG: hypothetical protein JSS66_18900 [Armatimonadetes bacterium]|nr:hypothetical protein [Armatimonadota bacterium]